MAPEQTAARWRFLLRVLLSKADEETMAQDQVNVRYMVNDVQESVDWYTANLGFTEISNVAPAFADVKRGALRLLLSGEKSSAGRPMPDGERPEPGGWNRFELVVADLKAEVDKLRARSQVPERHRDRPGRIADPFAGPVRQPHRAVPARAPSLTTSTGHADASSSDPRVIGGNDHEDSEERRERSKRRRRSLPADRCAHQGAGRLAGRDAGASPRGHQTGRP